MARVIIVDDDKMVCSVISSMLDDAGVANTVAHTVSEGVAAATEFRPDVALVDLIMPETNGLDLAEKLKASHPDIRIILVTGDLDAEKRFGDAIRKVGVECILQKPFRMKEILQAIEG